jgi:lipoate-protein ligase B
VKHEKICAIGVRIKSRISMHGLALNINNDLGLFGKIVPCGIRHRGVTNMNRLTGKHIETGDVQISLINELLLQLGSAD